MVGALVQFDDSSFHILGPIPVKEDLNTCDVLAEVTGYLLYMEHIVLWWFFTTNLARYSGAEPFIHLYTSIAIL